MSLLSASYIINIIFILCYKGLRNTQPFFIIDYSINFNFELIKVWIIKLNKFLHFVKSQIPHFNKKILIKILYQLQYP